jgi:enediyne biosynthesis protein E4
VRGGDGVRKLVESRGAGEITPALFFPSPPRLPLSQTVRPERVSLATQRASQTASADESDYVVTNFGLNTHYQPTVAQPCRLYYADFSGTGEPQIVEALITAEGVWPLRGKAALEQAVPRLAEASPTHRQFASARLTELLGADALAAAYQPEVNALESGVLLNDGRGKFPFHPLPRLAQVAPAFGVVVTEVNGGGKADVCLVPNFHAPQRETGRMDGGVGLVALGVGDGTFDALWPDVSGFVVPGDARSLAVTDFNQDGWPDLAVGLHGGDTLAFQNSAAKSNRVVSVGLSGKGGESDDHWRARHAAPEERGDPNGRSSRR